MKATMMPEIAAAYVDSINTRDAARFGTLFADDAVVNDAGREFRGLAAIKAWGNSDIFAVNVTLDVVDVMQRDDATVVRTRVDGDFDRTGLPDPVIIDQEITGVSKIERLMCKLADA